jgi:steroid delta-isomerase-like uncharacterized protein
MERDEKKRLYQEHRAVEEARDLDSIVATFDDDCFLENVALGTRAVGRDAVRRSYEALFATFPDLYPTSEGEAYGDDLFVTWGTVHGTMSGAWLGIPPTGRSFTCSFINVVPFRTGRMQGEKIYFDLARMCRGVGVAVEEVFERAAATHTAPA